jgi:hypothetical protein
MDRHYHACSSHTQPRDQYVRRALCLRFHPDRPEVGEVSLFEECAPSRAQPRVSERLLWLGPTSSFSLQRESRQRRGWLAGHHGSSTVSGTVLTCCFTSLNPVLTISARWQGIMSSSTRRASLHYWHISAMARLKSARGQHVKIGDLLGEVGNSGNTTGSHLHFQLMRGDNPFTATGLPCRFRTYECYRHIAWETVTNGIPGKLERIRYRVE